MQDGKLGIVRAIKDFFDERLINTVMANLPAQIEAERLETEERERKEAYRQSQLGVNPYPKPSR